MRRLPALFLVPAVLLATACSGSTVGLGQTTDGGGASGGTGGASGGTGGAGGGTGGATGGSGGSAGNAGNGGSGGDTLTNDGTQATSKKLDLLLVVDNSASMADKQQVLADSASYVVNRLANPFCIGQNGVYVSPQPTDPGAACPAGSVREIAPVTDMHIGVITSSLGAAGATLCSPDWFNWDPAQNDRGHLIGKTRSGVTSYGGMGYLAWDPAGKLSPPGENDAATLASQLQTMITQAGEGGCGFEAPLESMYHFLADPAPWQDVQKDGSGVTLTTGIDMEVLAERQSFLRPDSAVMVVVLTDENDCSIIDDGLGWVAGSDQAPLPTPTSICATAPDDKCCHSCGQADPAGCPHDPVCDTSPNLAAQDDPIGLRCFDTKRRFGLDLLYPTERYANALRLPQICPKNHDLACGPGDTQVMNPLFAGGRSRSLVSFEVITGVPWQDVARKPDGSVPLSYMSANELIQNDRWNLLFDDVPPTDPFMLQSIDPRSGTNPITGAPIEPPSSAYGASIVNGHERDIPDRNDLQYTCTFRLASKKDCSVPGQDCDCGPGNSSGNPLCQDPATGAYGTTQYAAKAYPGLRELDVARALGYKGVVASICSTNTTDAQAVDYGYNPAVQAMIERLNRVLK